MLTAARFCVILKLEILVPLPCTTHYPENKMSESIFPRKPPPSGNRNILILIRQCLISSGSSPPRKVPNGTYTPDRAAVSMVIVIFSLIIPTLPRRYERGASLSA